MNNASNDVRDLFIHALDLEGEARDSFLADACAGNAARQAEVEQMLADSEKADDFFSNAHGSTTQASQLQKPYTEVEGERVGNFILRQQIGEGGFGMVWMAEQMEPVKRMVALKVVKAGMDTKQVLARFEAERQALAMMNHPNIAKVLEAGATTSGRPYFTMELVKGIPITDFCEQRKLDVKQRLELFRDVCSAVQHAHQKGVIHRDLKPSNVMVTLAGDKPLVKIIDFGIAKATQSKLVEKTLFTRFGQFLGTPVYMSPEQAAMSAHDVDTRSDIYSLGVLLYELLAGVPPFDQQALFSVAQDEMLRMIREEEPQTPSTRISQMQTQNGASAIRKSPVPASTLQGELDWIVMKAIEKDRSRRYESASAFAADIGRYLANEPVQAAAPSTLYLFRKFARRHKVALGTAAAMLALLLAGIATTTWQAARATDGMKRAVEAEKLAAQRLTDSESFANVLYEVLEGQLSGYWKPDWKKTLMAAAKTNPDMNPMEMYFFAESVFEFQKDKMIIHGLAGNTADNPPAHFTIKKPAQAGKTLEMEFIHDGELGKITVIIESTALTLKVKEDTFILNRISEAEFESFTEPDEESEMALKDISTQPIPDKPAAGKVHGKRFKVESATLEESCLRLWQGEGFLSHLEEFQIDLSSEKGDDFSGKTFAVKLNQDTNIQITRAYSVSTSSIKTSTYLGDYSMKLEFGTAKDGKIPGKIHLQMPDEKRSFVVGSFEAKLK